MPITESKTPLSACSLERNEIDSPREKETRCIALKTYQKKPKRGISPILGGGNFYLGVAGFPELYTGTPEPVSPASQDDAFSCDIGGYLCSGVTVGLP
jgi:hypothetical protein